MIGRDLVAMIRARGAGLPEPVRSTLRAVVAMLLPTYGMLVAMSIWWIGYEFSIGDYSVVEHLESLRFPDLEILLWPPFASANATFFVALLPIGYVFARIIRPPLLTWSLATAGLTGMIHAGLANAFAGGFPPIWATMPLWLIFFPLAVALTAPAVLRAPPALRPEFGRLLFHFAPATPRSEARLGVFALAVAAILIWIASNFDHTWLVPLLGIPALVLFRLGPAYLFHAGSGSDPDVCVLAHGVLIGTEFVPLSDFDRVVYAHREFETGPHETRSTHSASKWTFQSADGSNAANLELTYTDGVGKYLWVPQFHEALRTIGVDVIFEEQK